MDYPKMTVKQLVETLLFAKSQEQENEVKNELIKRGELKA